MTPLVAYLLLFIAVGVGFIFVHLVAGKLIRPSTPNVEKGTIYECGEPTIGSAWVQFDLRFYVVALLFVIFDVEVAFFFPWAEVFGKANAIATADMPTTAEDYVAYAEKMQDLAAPRYTNSTVFREAEHYEKITGRRADGTPVLEKDAAGELRPRGKLTQETLESMLEEQKTLQQKRKDKANLTNEEAAKVDFIGPLKKGEFARNREAASTLAWLALGEVLIFFGVLLVGFAYLWRRGDLEWVRSTAAERMEDRTPRPPVTPAPPEMVMAPRQTVQVGEHH